MRSRPILLFALAATACASAPEPAPPYPAPLWKATRAGDPAVFHLAGSIHLRPDKSAPFQDVLDAAVDQADVLVLEADVDLSVIEALGLVAWHGLTWRPLSTRLSPALYLQLRKKLKALGRPPTGLDLFRPWLAAEVLHVWELEGAGYSPKLGIDNILRDRAEAQGKPVRFMETAGEQLAIFSSMEEELQLSLLENAITSTQAVAQTDRLLQAYDEGALGYLERWAEGSSEERPAFTRALLDERNAGFAEDIDRMAKQDARILVVVGAAHFVGPRSVQALLEERGFAVHRMSTADVEALLAASLSPPVEDAGPQDRKKLR